MLLNKYFSSMQQDPEGQKPRLADTTITNNGDNSIELIDDDYGFADKVDPNLTLELENLKMEQLKVKEEQLNCRQRMLMLKQQDRRPLHHSTMSNRCILPDGKIVVRNHPDRSADLDQSAGAGDSRVPALQRVSARDCVTCGAAADAFCARCGVTPYCSPRCQKRDWAERHRSVCHNLVRLAAEENEEAHAPVNQQLKIQNPAPLRRPHAVSDNKQERPRRDEDNSSRVSDQSTTSFRRLQDRARSQTVNDNKKPLRAGNDFNQNTYRQQNHTQNNDNKKVFPNKPDSESFAEAKPPMRQNFKPTASQPAAMPVASPPAVKPVAKPAASAIMTEPKAEKTSPPSVPKSYLIEQLSIGDEVLLSVDGKASDCRSSTGDFVCLSMHEKFETLYQMLCDEYTTDCDADNEQYKLTPGVTCSYFVQDEGWYRGRCLNPTTIALIDSSKIVSVTAADKFRKLPIKYQLIPEFSCVLESKDAKLQMNLKCTLESKSGDEYKVSLESVETGAALGQGVITRWLPAVEYPPAKTVIPEIARPSLVGGSRVLLVHATSLDRVFVRPAAKDKRRAYDELVQQTLLAGMKAEGLRAAPRAGQAVLLRAGRLRHRALCTRTSAAQNKYLLDYAEYGNLEVCRDLSEMCVCPPELDLSVAPTLVSMIKLTAEAGEFTPSAAAYLNKLKDSEVELILTLPNGEASAPNGTEATLKIADSGEVINRKVAEMCTPDWKKFQDMGGDVVESERLMYSDLEYQDLPAGPSELDILDVSVMRGGMLSGCKKGDPHAEYVMGTLTTRMAEYCNSELGRQPYLPKPEELCIAQCPPYPQWFRAVFIEQLSGAGGLEAKVCYIDYGNLDVVPVSLIRKMLPEFVRGVPVVVNILEIKDFPTEDVPEEVLVAGAKHLRLDEEGRGVLAVRSAQRLSVGVYEVEAPALLKAMFP